MCAPRALAFVPSGAFHAVSRRLILFRTALPKTAPSLVSAQVLANHRPAFYTHKNPASATRVRIAGLAPPSARIVAVMSDLATKTCVSCRGGVPPLKNEELASLQKQVDGWNVIEEHHVTKAFKFPDFREALKFVNLVGELAEEQGHHPDIFLAWGKVEITTWTHKINGLTESDFILAAKIDQLYKP
jgi:4a-hydroxytetrahydrobiopterin dehydratase